MGSTGVAPIRDLPCRAIVGACRVSRSESNPSRVFDGHAERRGYCVFDSTWISTHSAVWPLAAVARHRIDECNAHNGRLPVTAALCSL
jgi:hypothetical protein